MHALARGQARLRREASGAHVPRSRSPHRHGGPHGPGHPDGQPGPLGEQLLPVQGLVRGRHHRRRDEDRHVHEQRAPLARLESRRVPVRRADAARPRLGSLACRKARAPFQHEAAPAGLARMVRLRQRRVRRLGPAHPRHGAPVPGARLAPHHRGRAPRRAQPVHLPAGVDHPLRLRRTGKQAARRGVVVRRRGEPAAAAAGTRAGRRAQGAGRQVHLQPHGRLQGRHARRDASHHPGRADARARAVAAEGHQRVLGPRDELHPRVPGQGREPIAVPRVGAADAGVPARRDRAAPRRPPRVRPGPAGVHGTTRRHGAARRAGAEGGVGGVLPRASGLGMSGARRLDGFGGSGQGLGQSEASQESAMSEAEDGVAGTAVSAAGFWLPATGS